MGTISVCLIAAFVLYLPGLRGDFLLDDQAGLANLQRMSALTWEQLQVFSASSHAGPLGRPLAMLSFGLQYAAWPADPGAFKLVNVLIHLANGGLVAWLLVMIAQASGRPRDSSAWALAAAAIWLLHPIQVSTTLYVIQRMTLLSASFTLAGLLAYVYGRQQVAAGNTGKGLMLASTGIIFGTALAIACKENGILLPVFALAIEYSLFSRAPLGRAWALWRAVFLYLPIVAGTVYLSLHMESYLHATGRLFTFGERLLTEPRVVMDYLRKILLLPPFNFGVFFDDYPRSTSLFSPPATILALGALFLLATSAFWLRKRWPMYGFAMLWFLGGHLLESSIIPLELYFEHRNYLPSLGITAGIAYAAIAAWRQPKWKNIGIAAIALWCIALLALTWQQTRLWGSPLAQAAIWAREHPHSQRALERAGVLFAMEGQPDRARSYFQLLEQTFPSTADGPMFQAYLTCLYPARTFAEMSGIESRLATAQFSRATLGILAEITRRKESHRCEGISDRDLHNLISIVVRNPHFAASLPTLYLLQGRLHAANGDFGAAITALDAAFKAQPNKEIAFMQLQWAIRGGMHEQIEGYVNKTRQATTGNHAHDALIDRQLPP